MNQHKCPSRYSQAGQPCLVSLEQFLAFQQFCLLFPDEERRWARRKSNCRSAWTGTFLHPCSKLWTALREVPRSCANSFCVLPRVALTLENSLLRTDRSPAGRIWPGRLENIPGDLITLALPFQRPSTSKSLTPLFLRCIERPMCPAMEALTGFFRIGLHVRRGFEGGRSKGFLFPSRQWGKALRNRSQEFLLHRPHPRKATRP